MTGYSGTRLAKKLGALPLHADRFVRGRLAPTAARLIAMVVLAAGLLENNGGQEQWGSDSICF